MADDSVNLVLGFLVGAVVVGLILWHVRRTNGQQQQAALTTHNVVRDDEGRIQSVDTLTGLPMGHEAQTPPAMPAQQRPPAPQMNGDGR